VIANYLTSEVIDRALASPGPRGRSPPDEIRPLVFKIVIKKEKY